MLEIIQGNDMYYLKQRSNKILDGGPGHLELKKKMLRMNTSTNIHKIQ